MAAQTQLAPSRWHVPDLPVAAAGISAVDREAVIDALIGYSLRGAPDDAYRPLIAMAPLGDGPVISLDLPSGIDASTGDKPGDAVVADMTLALALPKRGTEIGDGRRSAGVRFLADIGIPAGIFEELGVESLPDFAGGPLLRLD